MLIMIKGNAILSGYDSESYSKLLENGWNRKVFELSTSTSPCEDNPVRKEVIWVKNNWQ